MRTNAEFIQENARDTERLRVVIEHSEKLANERMELLKQVQRQVEHLEKMK
jgi:phosphotransferase system IIB component